ncbi:MAG: HAD-IB family hydrolase [Fibrobacter sp.]|nr:HAD-IB family hydrolase [Fibrobacter sp.]
MSGNKRINLRPAAIFDLDGTLIPHTSAEKTFSFYLIRSGGLNVLNLLQMVKAVWESKGNFHALARTNKNYLKNKSVTVLNDIARHYFEPRIDTMVFPEMRKVIEHHRRAGDLLLLLTGTLDLIAACFVRYLKFDGYRAATLEIKDGKYTGKLIGILPYGIGKLEVLSSMKRQFHFDRDLTYYYANVYSDRYVMNAVENPVAVNPDRKLRLYAKRIGWKVLDVA